MLMYIQQQIQERIVNLYTLLDSEVFLLHSCILVHSCSLSSFFPFFLSFVSFFRSSVNP